LSLGAETAVGDRQLLAPDRHRPRRPALRPGGDGADRRRRPALPGAAARARRTDHARRQHLLDGHRRPLRRRGVFRLARSLGASLAVSVFLAASLADLLTYVTTSVQLAWAFPDPVGGFAASFAKFAGIFAVTQIPLAISEGLLTVLIFNALARFNPANCRP
jgi:hypothetical protein